MTPRVEPSWIWNVHASVGTDECEAAAGLAHCEPDLTYVMSGIRQQHVMLQWHMRQKQSVSQSLFCQDHRRGSDCVTWFVNIRLIMMCARLQTQALILQ